MNISRVLALRTTVKELVERAGEGGLAIIKADITAGQFTGELAFLQPDFNEVKVIVDFLELLIEIKVKLGL